MDNDAILQAMTKSEKKAAKAAEGTKSSTNGNSKTKKSSQLKPPPPGSTKNLNASSSSLLSSTSKKKKNMNEKKSPTRGSTKFAPKDAPSASASARSSSQRISAAYSAAARAATTIGEPTANQRPVSLRNMETSITRKAAASGASSASGGRTGTGTTTTTTRPLSMSSLPTSSSSSPQQDNVRPGAYSIQGSTVSRATTGTLTKNEIQHQQHQRQTPTTTPAPFSTATTSINTSTLTLTTPTPSEPSAAAAAATAATASSSSRGGDIANTGNTSNTNTDKKKKKKKKSSKKGIVVAAELTEDIEQMLERKIEEEVRKRILAQAAKADIVAYDHGVDSQKRQMLHDEDEEARRVADLKKIHKPKGVREKLFGDKRQTVDVSASPECIRKRHYLQWTVKPNPTIPGQWVTSVMTNQKAMSDGNNLEAELTKASYSATTQAEAYETGLANAVPLMQSFDDNPICSVCNAKFALFRRPCHCRNCGVCICANCATTWPSRMFPPTFVRKNDKSVLNVCIACDWVQTSFREALLTGNRQAAEDLYATGNVNIRSPFCLEKNAEEPFPIHLAVLGGNLGLIKWMIETRYVPLRMVQTQKNGRKPVEVPLLTSHGRSPMAIALLHQRLDIVRYFVVDLNLSFFAEENLNTGVALANFTTLLKLIPTDFFAAAGQQRQQLQLSFTPSSDLSESSLGSR